MKQKVVSFALCTIFGLNAAGCATIAIPPIMAVSTPISCIKESIGHGSLGENIVVVAISPFLIPIGLLAGIGLGLEADLEGAPGKAFEIAADPCAR